MEVGGGVTLLVTPSDQTDNSGLEDLLTDAFFLEGQGTLIFPVGMMGWRYHPKDGAILRLTATPFLIERRIRMYGGVSLGFTFYAPGQPGWS